MPDLKNNEEELSSDCISDSIIILVGLMGCGKTSVGRRLSKQLNLPFVDSDSEIEKAAGCSVSEIFSLYGEKEFRAGERRVMSRLLNGEPCVLATGGGAYIDEQTRKLCKQKGVTVWLKADLDTLVERTSGWKSRPLLKQGDPREILDNFINTRYPIYAESDITVETLKETPEQTAERVISAVKSFPKKA